MSAARVKCMGAVFVWAKIWKAPCVLNLFSGNCQFSVEIVMIVQSVMGGSIAQNHSQDLSASRFVAHPFWGGVSGCSFRVGKFWECIFSGEDCQFSVEIVNVVKCDEWIYRTKSLVRSKRLTICCASFLGVATMCRLFKIIGLFCRI